MTKNAPKKPTVLDLFAGAGGLGLGLTWAGFRVQAANEFEADFAATYHLNHPETEMVAGDILRPYIRKKLIAASQGVDVVAGGPPCQGFSTVGKKNEDDPRNSLFYSFLGIVAELRPRAVLFENVSGFRRMYDGRAYQALLRGLDDLGYPVHHCDILNAVHYGIPQLRQRAVVVAFREDCSFRFPEPTHAETDTLFSHTAPRTLSDALGDLPLVASGESATRYRCAPQNEYQQLMRTGASEELTEHDGPWHGEHLLEVIAHVPLGGTILDVPKALRPRSYFSNTYSRLWWDRPSTTITRNFGTPSSSRCIHPLADRGLTTREGARLQGFPDTYTFIGTRSRKNLQIGNAVPPLLAKAIGIELLPNLNGQMRNSR